jgi:hypothetical protein
MSGASGPPADDFGGLPSYGPRQDRRGVGRWVRATATATGAQLGGARAKPSCHTAAKAQSWALWYSPVHAKPLAPATHRRDLCEHFGRRESADGAEVLLDQLAARITRPVAPRGDGLHVALGGKGGLRCGRGACVFAGG